MFRISSFLAVAGLVVVLAGCSGEGAGKLAVKGTVNFESKPLDKGFIVFEMEGDKSGFRSGANVENGKFALDQKNGLKPGKYIVRVSSTDATNTLKPDEAPGIAPPPAKEKIPSSWNGESKNTVEAKAGATDFNFDIK
jgi:hypothetical protein